MPVVAAVAGSLFLAASSVAAVVGAATAIVVGLAVVGAALTVASILFVKKPAPASQQEGQQLDMKLDPNAAAPVLIGRSAVGGNITHRGTFGAKNAFLAIAAALSVGGPIQGIEAYQAGDQTVVFNGNPETGVRTATAVLNSPDSELYVGKLKMRYLLGERPMTQSLGAAAGVSLWTKSTDKISGIATAVQILEYDQDAFPQGAPKSLWVASGVKLYDPRKDSTRAGGSGSHRFNNPATFEFSENPYIQALNWTLGRWENGSKVFGIGALENEVDFDSFIAGANVADANGWKAGGQINSTDDKFAVLSEILGAGGGLPIARGAQISCTYAAPKTSVITLGRGDVVGDIEIYNTTEFRNRANRIVPRYREEAQNWELFTGEGITNAAYLTEDNGEQKTREVDFYYCQDATQAAQLAAYELVNSREFLTVRVTAKPHLLNARVGDLITLNVPDANLVGVPMMVTTREFDSSAGTVNFALKAETATKHAFALGQTQTAPASPNIAIADPTLVEGPAQTAWGVTGITLTNAAGDRLPALRLSGLVDDPQAENLLVDYSDDAGATWTNWGTFPAKQTTQIDISGVKSLTAYTVRLRYKMVSGVTSPAVTYQVTSGVASLAGLDTATAKLDTIESGATAGTNLLPNSLLKTNLAGWNTSENVTRVDDGTEPAYFAVNGGASITSERIPIADARQLFLDYQVQTAGTGNGRWRHYHRIRDASGATLSYTPRGGAISDTNGAWRDDPVTLDLADYPTAHTIEFTINIVSTSGVLKVRYPYLSGVHKDSDNTGLHPKVQTVDYGATSSENIIRNPRFDDGDSNLVGGQLFTDENINYYRIPNSGFAQFLRRTPTGNNGSVAINDLHPVELNSSYIWSAYVRTVGGSIRARPIARPRRSVGNAGQNTTLSDQTIDTNGAYQLISGVIDIPDDPTFDFCEFNIQAIGGTGTALDIAFPRASQMEKGATVGATLDGLSANIKDSTGNFYGRADLLTGEGIAAGLQNQGAGATANSLGELNANEGAKLTGIQSGATVGADFNNNVSNVPAELTDGRIQAGLTAAGIVNKPLPATVKLDIAMDEISDGSTFKRYLDAERTKLTAIEENADVTALAQRFILAQFPIIEIRENEAGNIGNRVITHFTRAGADTLDGGTYTLESVLLGGATLSVNATNGNVTGSGITQSGSYTIRYTHTDGIATDLVVNVTFIEAPAGMRSISASVSFVGWFENQTSSVTVTHELREGSTTQSGVAWSKVTSTTGTVAVNATTGAATITGVTASGIYTIRGSKDSIDTDKTINIQFYPDNNNGGGGGGGGPPYNPEFNAQ